MLSEALHEMRSSGFHFAGEPSKLIEILRFAQNDITML